MTLKEQIRQVLDESTTVAGLIVNGAIALLILASAAIFAIQTYPLPESLQLGLQRVDQLFLALFTLEYLIRLWAAERPLRFVFSLYGLIDLISILPFILGFVDTRSLRLIRWLRILRLARFFEEKIWFKRIGGSKGLIFARILFTLLSIIFIYAGAIYQAEHETNGADFATFLDAVYFAVVTMTTVGFGDITPVTEAGRGLTIAMILTGVALIPRQIGSFIQQFTQAQPPVREAVRGAVQVACAQCALVGHEVDAQFCRRCGATLPEQDAMAKPLERIATTDIQSVA